MKRHLTAAVALPLLYLYITKLPPLYFLVLLSVLSALAMWEFCAMYRTSATLKFAGIALGVLALAVIYLKGGGTGVFLAAFIAVSAIRLFTRPDPASSLVDISPVIVGLIYIPGLLSCQIALRDWGHGWILFLYGTVWASDSLAYYFGNSIGGPKLYRSVSPNKTVSGAIGSVLGGMLAAALLAGFTVKSMPLSATLMLGFLIGLVSIVGDLVESMFKRDAGVKDSGALIPGHGGILDKIDGVLFAGPAVQLAVPLIDRFHI